MIRFFISVFCFAVSMSGQDVILPPPIDTAGTAVGGTTGAGGFDYRLRTGTVCDDSRNDVDAGMREGACKLLDDLRRWTGDGPINLYARWSVNGRTQTGDPNLLHRLLSTLWSLAKDRFGVLKIVPDIDPKALGGRDVVLDCFSPEVSGGKPANMHCSAQSTLASQFYSFDTTISVVTWSTQPKEQHGDVEPATMLQRVGTHFIDRPSHVAGFTATALLGLGADKIEIAWRLGRALAANRVSTRSAKELEKQMLEDAPDEENASESKEVQEMCPSMSVKELKTALVQFASETEPMFNHIERMRLGYDVSEFYALTEAVIGKIDPHGTSLRTFNAPQEVADAYHLGVLSSAFEVFGAKTCAQQTFKAALSGCILKHFSRDVMYVDGEWLTPLTALLSKYGITLSLPAVDCTVASQKRFHRYSTHITRAAWAAMRKSFAQRTGTFNNINTSAKRSSK